MENVWIALIALASSIIISFLAPNVTLWLKYQGERQQRLDDAEIRRQERIEDRLREDAREARALEKLEIIKKQTDGVIAQVTSLAKSTGRVEGSVEASRTAANTAATLALGQQQGRDAERESVSTNLKSDGERPLPVSDDRTATASERVADASERVANVAEKKKE